jgi:hypothetical protein
MSPQHTRSIGKNTCTNGVHFESVRQSLIAQRNALDANGRKTPYRVIGARYGVGHMEIYRIVEQGSIPRDAEVRRKLGIVKVYPSHPVVRHTELRRRIAALHFSPEILREIERELIP